MCVDTKFRSDVHANYTKHKVYINIFLISFLDFLSSAEVRNRGKNDGLILK